MAGLDTETIESRLPAAFAAYARHVEIAAPTFKMRLLPGVIDLLGQLADHPGFILGLVTGNVREAAPHKLQAVGLNPGLFRFGAFGSEHMDRNQLPALALYHLEQQLGASVLPESALVIGDTPHDIACARHAGVQVLCVATGTYTRQALASHSPDYLLDDLGDTPAVMDILTGF
jgi:phosphoglycolate phosphatase-like HAD superfamily hydrolase